MVTPKMLFAHFHTRHSKLRWVQVKCCTKEILCAHRLLKIRGNEHWCLFGHVARSDPANDTRRALAAPTPSQCKKLRWKRVVAEHSTPQDGMLPDRLTDW